MNSQHRANIPVHYAAQVYDRFTKDFLGPFDRLLADRLLQESRRNPFGRRVLDIGCGTSRFLLRLASMPPLNEFSLVGLDLFSDMLSVSRANVERERLLDRIQLVQADVHRLPFQDGMFDFAISRSTLHHWANPPAALIETRRILSPGGVALIHEIRRDPDPAALALFNHFRSDAGVEPSRLEEKYTVDEIRGFVERSGLGSEAVVLAPAHGYSSLGCEIRIAAPR